MKVKTLQGALRPGGLEITRRLVDICNFQPGQRVLDLGCGPGLTLEYLTNRKGLRAVGVDQDPAMIQSLQSRWPSLQAVEASGENLPFERGFFDGVMAECSLSVMDYHPAVLQEIRRVLKPGGRLAVSDLYLRRDWQCQPSDSSTPAACVTGARTYPQLRQLCAQHGFKLITWQDGTSHLKIYVAQYIMAHGSLHQSWLLPTTACGPGMNKRAIGYCYWAAGG